MRNADAAMYRAKDHGKNAFQFFTAELAEQANQRLEMETGLRRAIERRELILEYQPQVNLASNAVVGAEALVRWKRGGEIVSPASFIPIAEESHLIVAIDEWVLDKVCRQIVAWDKAGVPQVRVSINVSARHFRKPDMVADILAIIREHDVAPERLCIEITEGVLMDTDQARSKLQALVDFGLRISIDDFGTGFSSLSYLKRFPIHELKIDRSFIDGIASDADDRAISSAIIALAGNLGMIVVAEGVEAGEQNTELSGLGCGHGQGYFYARPMSVQALARWLLKRPAEQSTRESSIREARRRSDGVTPRST
jgi:EAL domain-containing protein (putative c-di-GMP-specific phosphodiesterase class I)